MEILNSELRAVLLSNWRAQQAKNNESLGEEEIDFMPVVKLFHPLSKAVWLFTEMDEDETLFGLCDLGQGYPELGYCSLSELKDCIVFGVGVERDTGFVADKGIKAYTEEARVFREIRA